MRQKIQRSMVIVIAITLGITYVLLTAIIYSRTVRLMEAEIRQEADYICKAVEISGPGYLKQLDLVQDCLLYTSCSGVVTKSSLKRE